MSQSSKVVDNKLTVTTNYQDVDVYTKEEVDGKVIELKDELARWEAYKAKF